LTGCKLADIKMPAGGISVYQSDHQYAGL